MQWGEKLIEGEWEREGEGDTGKENEIATGE
jgi:hypothetical protein